jgi:hypothetical protein
MYFVGNFQTYLLVAISIERLLIPIYNQLENYIFFYRYLMVTNKVQSRSVTFRKCFFIIILCLFLSSIWVVAPLLGWSYYVNFDFYEYTF